MQALAHSHRQIPVLKRTHRRPDEGSHFWPILGDNIIITEGYCNAVSVL